MAMRTAYIIVCAAQHNLSITQIHQSHSAIYRLRRSISRTAQSIDYADPSVAQRNISITQIHQSHSAIYRLCRSISRTAQSIDYADPSVAQRKHRDSGEIPSLAKVNVNKVAIFFGIVLIPPVCCSCRCTLLLYNAFMWTVSVKAGQSELNGARTNTQTNACTHEHRTIM